MSKTEIEKWKSNKLKYKYAYKHNSLSVFTKNFCIIVSSTIATTLILPTSIIIKQIENVKEENKEE